MKKIITKAKTWIIDHEDEIKGSTIVIGYSALVFGAGMIVNAIQRTLEEERIWNEVERDTPSDRITVIDRGMNYYHMKVDPQQD